MSYQVEVVEDGGAALEWVVQRARQERRGRVLVLMDKMMPVLDGIQATVALVVVSECRPRLIFITSTFLLLFFSFVCFFLGFLFVLFCVMFICCVGLLLF
jgi:hypothetical protein